MTRRLIRRERRALERLERKATKPVRPEPKDSCWYWLIPCIAAFLIYARSLSFGFIHDDWGQIVTNPQVKSWRFLPRILSTELWSQLGSGHGAGAEYYRPIFSLWLLVVHTAAGLSPFGWHLANILLHMIITFLVFKLAVAVLDSPIAASAAALLFAVHPVHIEDVCWVSAGNEIIYTGFVLCSLLLLFYGNRGSRPAYMWLSLAAWGAALFAKETTIALLPLFVLIAYFGWPRKGKRNIATALAFVLIAIAYLVVRWIVLQDLLAKIGNGEASWSQTLLMMPFTIEFYLHKLILPIYLSPYYRVSHLYSVPDFAFWSHAAAILFGIVFFVGYRLRKRTASAISVALVFLPLFPVIIGIHYFHNLSIEMVHDRYLYLPSLGLVLLFGLAVKWLGSRSRNATIAFSLLLAVVCVGLNLSQQYSYQDEKALGVQAFIVEGYRPEQFAEMMIKRAVDFCQHGGGPEGARELFKPPPSTVAFYRLSSGTLFFARSYDTQDDPMRYVTPEGVRGTVALDDLDFRVTACLNPELVGTLLAKIPASSTAPSATALAETPQ